MPKKRMEEISNLDDITERKVELSKSYGSTYVSSERPYVPFDGDTWLNSETGVWSIYMKSINDWVEMGS